MSGILIKILFHVSLLFSLVLVFKIVKHLIKQGKRGSGILGADEENRNHSFKSRLLSVSLLLLGAVWCLRFSVGYYSAYNPIEEIDALKPYEEVFNSLVHTLQTFSMDEDYTEYISGGKTMIADVYGEGAWVIDFYGIYAAVLNFLAPLAGGAILFEIISEFSPLLKLKLSNCCFWKDKYYFSELNDNSLALAKSILHFKKRNACIIFTDVYENDEEEKSTERLLRAKSMGAICVKDDLLHIQMHGRLMKVFLIDESENSNLQTLSVLLEKSAKIANKMEVYIFSSDRAHSNLDEEVSFIINKKSNHHPEDLPVVIPVNGVQNMVENLFSEIPLFEPIIDQDDINGKKTLNVTIIGSGVIGTEVFLTTYWCGQMLDCSLNITVVSKEKRNKSSTFDGEGDFEGRINYINPDILMSANPKSDLLIYSKDGKRSDPYFSYEYIESDVMSDDFMNLLKDESLLDTHYFIVALGSDEDNFAVADKLRQMVGAHHLLDGSHNKTIISYVVYNSSLSRILNQENKHRYSMDSDSLCDIIMCAFGSQESVYSVKNVFFEGHSDIALDVGKSYDSSKGLNESEHKRNKERRFKDIYAYQSDLAKALHRKYREFSAGFHNCSMFSTNDVEAECVNIPENAYLEFIINENKDECVKAGKKQGIKKLTILHELAWLEHRRWCAYMRTKGFRNPDIKDERGFRSFYSAELPERKFVKEHKFVALKLHPCLVECSKNGIHADFQSNGFIQVDTEFKIRADEEDCLDRLSLFRHKLDSSKEDFKRWDYPEFELSREEKARFNAHRIGS